MRPGSRLTFIAAVCLIPGLLGVSGPAFAEPEQAPRVAPTVLPAAAPVISGTPREIQNSTPIADPLTVGYASGLFLPKGAKKKKDKRGCNWNNQQLIKLATKKPRIGPGCTLIGGEWLVDFGYKKITKAKDVRIGQLVPDNYVFAQGAYAWTPQQRAAYVGTSTMRPAKKTRMTSQGLLTSDSNQLFTKNTFNIMRKINDVLVTTIKNEDAQTAQLNQLRQANPLIFDNWSVATMLNMKSWGLSLSPGTVAEFTITLDACTNKPSANYNGQLITLLNPGTKPSGNGLFAMNPCTNSYSVPNQAITYNITPVPYTATAAPGTDSTVLNGYGTPQGPPISRFLFGMHAPAHWKSDRASGFDGPIEQSSIPTVPVGSIRLWDTETAWADVEPEKGQFTYSKLQKQIEMAQRLDARPMLVLGGTPAWAGSGGRNSVPNSVEDYKNYVRAVACHFGESIFAYEVWNEANIRDFWAGNAAQMADLTMAAFEAIRGCNPSALVVAASTTTRATGSFGSFYPAYLEELKARNWPVDAYSVHSYPAASGGADARILGIGQFKTMLAFAGAPKTTIFDTETNYGLAGLGENRIAYAGTNAQTLIARTYIDSARYGFDSTYWFVWTRGEDSKYGIQMNPNSGGEHQAWRNTYDWLVGAQFQRCFNTSDGITVCQFNRGGDNFSIVWRGDVGGPTIATPPGYFTGLGSRVCDLTSTCEALNPSLMIDVGPWPVRIDGAPLSGGPSPSAPTPQGPMGTRPGAPIIIGLDLTYGPSNKADATARWAPPAQTEGAEVTGFTYMWLFCKGTSCSRVAAGSTGPKDRSVTVDLSSGPGVYKFQIGADSKAGPGDVATQDVELKRSDAAPPSNVLVGARAEKGEITWNEPDLRAGLLAGYEVQVRNLPSGPWVTVAKQAKGARAAFTGGELDLAVGKQIVARVRTVLKSGATSIYAASEPLTITGLLPPPETTFSSWSSESEIAVFSVSRTGASKPFPGQAYQVRYSNDGVTWENATFGRCFIGSTTPSSNPTLLPYNDWCSAKAAEGSFFTRNVKVEVRAVDDSGTQPSEWSPVLNV